MEIGKFGVARVWFQYMRRDISKTAQNTALGTVTLLSRWFPMYGKITTPCYLLPVIRRTLRETCFYTRLRLQLADF